MLLRKIGETVDTITLGWDPVHGVVEYRGTRKSWLKPDGSQRWAQAGPGATQMKFAKDEWYRIEALEMLDQGVYPTQVIYPAQNLYPSQTHP